MPELDPSLSAEERKYFESRGESAIPAPSSDASTPPPDAPPPPPDDARPPDAAGAADANPPVQDLKEPTHVPYAALADERKTRKEMEERVRQAELLQARMEERFKMLTAQPPAPPPQPPKPPPRADQDIFGAVDHLSKELDRRGKEIDGYKEQIVSEAKQKEMDKWARAHEADFISKTPDYYRALHFLRLGRALELNAIGVTGPAVGDQLNAEERTLMQRAAYMRKSPAELAYNLAKARGYSKDLKLPGIDNMPGAAGAPDANRRLDVIEAGQRQGGSMSDVGGGGRASAEVTLADLAKMSDKDFDEYRTKNPAKYRRLKGAEH